MRRAVPLLLACLLPGLPAAAKPVSVSLAPVALDRVAPDRRHVGRLELLAGFELRSDDPAVGGLSGLAVDGDRALMVSDKGTWVTARLRHDVTGRLSGIDCVEIAPMADLGGGRLRAGYRDAEAVRRLPDGRLLVSFEQRHRLWVYAPGDDPPAARPKALAVPGALSRAAPNGGMEAIAALPDGRIAVLAESLRLESGNLAGWLLDGRRASPVEYVTDGAFVPTDMDLLPDGGLLVLERRFSLLGGLGAQLRLVPAAQLGESVWRPLPVARLEPPLTVDNFEGLAVARRGDEPPLVYIVSDDNFSPLLRTLLLQFRLLPAP